MKKIRLEGSRRGEGDWKIVCTSGKNPGNTPVQLSSIYHSPPLPPPLKFTPTGKLQKVAKTNEPKSIIEN